jgi:subtilisin family serine protease
VYAKLSFLGKGIKVAIMDTGVDWRHPALGGCFGPGCKVAFGKAFMADDGTYINEDDPLTTCVSGGHGTHVAGIIGMQDLANSTFGLVGVAPEADIGMYRKLLVLILLSR